MNRVNNGLKVMAKAATEAVNRLFRLGFNYSEAEVLLDLRQPDELTGDLSSEAEPETAEKVMTVLDEINRQLGRKRNFAAQNQRAGK